MIRTARTRGSVGPRALVPRFVEEFGDRRDRILDYGAGPQAAHAKRLRAAGFTVDAHDLARPIELRPRHYDIAYASNVINIQPDAEHTIAVLEEIRATLRPGGALFFNYPEPRYQAAIPEEICDLAEGVFGGPIFEIRYGSGKIYRAKRRHESQKAARTK